MKVTANDLETVKATLSYLKDKIGIPINITRETDEAIWFAPNTDAYYFSVFIHNLGPSDYNITDQSIHINN